VEGKDELAVGAGGGNGLLRRHGGDRGAADFDGRAEGRHNVGDKGADVGNVCVEDASGSDENLEYGESGEGRLEVSGVGLGLGEGGDDVSSRLSSFRWGG
jgi:hypothetical protein